MSDKKGKTTCSESPPDTQRRYVCSCSVFEGSRLAGPLAMAKLFVGIFLLSSFFDGNLNKEPGNKRKLN